jgi:hypothetical protein
MSDAVPARKVAAAKASLAGDLVDCLGGRYSRELGIDLDRDDEVERWALAATLFGARISADTAEHTFRALSNAGLRTLADAGSCDTAKLIALLDEGGYARYDFRTAGMLHRLAAALRERGDGRISALVERAPGLAELTAELDALPGWGPVTVGLFTRELRGKQPWLEPALDARAREAAEHLGLVGEEMSEAEMLKAVERLARRAGVDVRDLEGALVRASLQHGRRFAACAGGEDCELVHRETARRC